MKCSFYDANYAIYFVAMLDAGSLIAESMCKHSIACVGDILGNEEKC